MAASLRFSLEMTLLPTIVCSSPVTSERRFLVSISIFWMVKNCEIEEPRCSLTILSRSALILPCVRGLAMSSTAFIQYSRFCGLRSSVSTTVSRVIISRYSRLTPAELTVSGERSTGCSTTSRSRDRLTVQSSRVITASATAATARMLRWRRIRWLFVWL